MPADPVDILQRLVRCASVTPEDAGAQPYLSQLLGAHGFTCTPLPFRQDGTPDVHNLFARAGGRGPHFCFAGHTDVVPPGELGSWRHPPFEAVIDDGVIYGRGTSDMKGSIAAFSAAAVDFIAENPADWGGSISLLITGDEEGPAINGTQKMLKWLAAQDQVPDHCLVGEPTCSETFGDTLKIGRRGSIHFEIEWLGVQGHAAYPHLADNPIPKLSRLLDRLASTRLDEGSDHFEPSTLSITTFDVGNPATNVIPEKAYAHLNVRFNNLHTPQSLTKWVSDLCERVKTELGGSYSIGTRDNAAVFVTENAPFIHLIQDAIARQTGLKASLGTGGGTSDARFIKDYCPVVEFGPTNATIHQIDERITVTELLALKSVYREILDSYFAKPPSS